ncbi:hypothetical protein J132_03463, partial [Termitomyces sp. J132]
ETSNYVLELPMALQEQRSHPKFHVLLLQPYKASNNALFLNQVTPEPYNFNAPDNQEWFVDDLLGHHWDGMNFEFEVCWSLEDTTWESSLSSNCLKVRNTRSAVNAVLLYVTKYITKLPLKTYTVFEAVRTVLSRSQDIISGHLPIQEKARSLMTKMANVLSAKSEMGSLMICMYLLGNPDHYPDHIFINIHWLSFVQEVKHAWLEDDMLVENTYGPDKIALSRRKGHMISLSQVFDYIYCGPELQAMPLYEWAVRCEQIKFSKWKRRQEIDSNDDECKIHSICHPSAVTIYFTEEHPLSASHATIVHPPHQKQVPNLIGTNLPQCDNDKKEEYWIIMLTLFKPWHSDVDLRNDNNTWNTVFTNP